MGVVQYVGVVQLGSGGVCGGGEGFLHLGTGMTCWCGVVWPCGVTCRSGVACEYGETWVCCNMGVYCGGI